MENLPQNWGLTAKELEEIRRYIQKYPEIHTAKIFGSRALGTYKEASDVDIAVFGDGVTDKTARDLKFDLEEESYLPYFFDVISYNDITVPSLREHIDRHGVIIYRQGWREVKLGEIVNISGGGTPKTSVKEYWNGDILWLSVTDFNNNRRYVYETEKSITEKGLNESSTKLLKKGQLIISARGTVGALAQLARDMAFNQSCYGLDAKEEYTFNDFLYYLVKWAIQQLQQQTHGAVFDTITRETFNFIDVVLPPLPEQKAIADILGSLDDKIELLHRQNKTLEALAETIFRKWFVEEADEDWEEKALDEVANFLNGLPLQKYPPDESGYLPVIKIRELRNGVTESTDKASVNIPEQYIIDHGDVIFSWSGSLEVDLWKYGKGALNQHLFKVTSEKYPKWFYYYWIKNYLPEFRDIAQDKATTMGHIQRHHLHEAKVIVPPEETMCKLNYVFDPLLNKIISNNAQIRTLERLRDTLLPKLISGEVRLKL